MSKTIRYPVAEYLDVLAITSRNQVFPRTKPTIGLRLWPFVPSMDEIFSEIGDYLLKVVITGDGVVPPITALLKFTWTKNWQTSLLALIPESSVQSTPSVQEPPMLTIPPQDLSYLADPTYDRFWPEANRKKLFLRVAELLNENPRHFIADFNALILAGAQHLESNDDLVWISNELEKNGHKHPLKELGDYVPERDWLRFLQWVNVRPNTDTKWGYGYVDAAQEWPKREGYPQPATRFPLRLAVMSEIKPP